MSTRTSSSAMRANGWKGESMVRPESFHVVACLPPASNVPGFVQTTGTGTLILGDGGSYSGEFSNGEITGTGTRVWPDGTKYTGEFVDGEKHGDGELWGVVWETASRWLHVATG